MRVNGFFSVAFANADGTEFTCQGQYKEIVLNNHLVFTWGWTNPLDATELISLQFTSDGQGTLMLFEQSNIDLNTLHNYEQGWHSTFQKLERALEQ